MIDSNLTELIKNIEDDLIKHIIRIKDAIPKAGEPYKVTKLILTPESKSYPLTATVEDIESDPDNIVVDVVPKWVQPFKNEICTLSKEEQDDLLLKMGIGYTTIQNIKNNIISLNYTNKQTSDKIVNELLKSKIPTLDVLKYAINQSNIINPKFRNSSDELLIMIDRLKETLTENTGKPQQLIIPGNVLKWLKETISKNGNGKAFVEEYNGKLKWLQNKQNARVLLTHDAIKGDLSDNKAIAQASELFIYDDVILGKNVPLRLGNDDKRQENANTIDLRNFLNELKTRPSK